jgi:hypothetical protein
MLIVPKLYNTINSTGLLGSPRTAYVSPCRPKIPKFQKNPSMFPECRPNTNLLLFMIAGMWKFSLCIANMVLKHVKKQKKSIGNFYFGGNFWIFLPYFYSLLWHTKFWKNPSMFVESRANTNVHRFHAQTASWWPFWISNFS